MNVKVEVETVDPVKRRLAIEVSAEDAIQKTKALWSLRNEYVKRVRTPRASALLVPLVEDLFLRPITTIHGAMETLDVSHAQAAAHLRTLVKHGIVEEITGGTRNLRFMAKELLALVHA